MNPVALQLAKGDPFAPTSWGAFGPGWLWVSPAVSAGQTVAVGTATERELVNPITPLISREVPMGQAAETEVANPITAFISRQVFVGQVTEVELGRTITPVLAVPVFVNLGQAVERELAQLITPTKTVPGQIGSVCEVLSPTAICEVEV